MKSLLLAVITSLLIISSSSYAEEKQSNRIKLSDFKNASEYFQHLATSLDSQEQCANLLSDYVFAVSSPLYNNAQKPTEEDLKAAKSKCISVYPELMKAIKNAFEIVY
ncbi:MULTISPECIES: hypothetical protein [Providencia]|uniref:hypothetical protein n=1 Tax=Providencia TaxID=586 RepID=UPI00234ACFEF|nr:MULTISPECIES: hypothetical protein [Providencia]